MRVWVAARRGCGDGSLIGEAAAADQLPSIGRQLCGFASKSTEVSDAAVNSNERAHLELISFTIPLRRVNAKNRRSALRVKIRPSRPTYSTIEIETPHSGSVDRCRSSPSFIV
jgi:hypothetical protein